MASSAMTKGGPMKRTILLSTLLSTAFVVPATALASPPVGNRPGQTVGRDDRRDPLSDQQKGLRGKGLSDQLAGTVSTLE